jgi:hypothetical protein
MSTKLKEYFLNIKHLVLLKITQNITIYICEEALKIETLMASETSALQPPSTYFHHPGAACALVLNQSEILKTVLQIMIRILKCIINYCYLGVLF